YTGYSAICLAEGLAARGKLTTIDQSDDLEERVRAYFEAASFEETTTCLLRTAMELIPTLATSSDLVFIDADRASYTHYYDMVIDKVRTGGYIIADNVLWSGKVVPEGRTKLDKDTQVMLDFNAKVHMDARVQNVLLPIRDGLMILRKL